MPVDTVFRGLERHLPPPAFEMLRQTEQGILRYAGGDGYVVSRDGARRLLDIARGLGGLMPLDAMTLLACAGTGFLAGMERLPGAYRRALPMLPACKVNGVVHGRTLVSHRPGRVGGSVRGRC